MKYTIINIGRDVNVNQIVSALAKNKVVENIIHSITNDDCSDDLSQDIYIQLLTSEKTKQLYLTGQLQFYICGIVKNNVLSKNSAYYKTYKKFMQFSTNEIPEIKQ